MNKSSFTYVAKYQHKPVLLAFIRGSVYVSTDSLSLIFGQPFYPDYLAETVEPYGTFFPAFYALELHNSFEGYDNSIFQSWIYHIKTSAEGVHFPTTATGHTFTSFNHATNRLQKKGYYHFKESLLATCTSGLVPLSNLTEIPSAPVKYSRKTKIKPVATPDTERSRSVEARSGRSVKSQAPKQPEFNPNAIRFKQVVLPIQFNF